MIDRAPELLLGSRVYTAAIDIWSIGCIFAEILKGDPIFPGQGEIDQIDKIFRAVGAPNEARWPSFSTLPNASKLPWKLPSQ